MDKNASELPFSKSEKTFGALLGTMFSLVGLVLFGLPFVVPSSGTNLMSAWTVGAFFLVMVYHCCPWLFTRFQYRADDTQFVFHNGYRMQRIAWSDVVSYHVPPQSWYPSRPQCFSTPVMTGVNGKVLFFGSRYRISDENFAQHAQFWQFVEAQLKSKKQNAPVLDAPQRLLRRQVNRYWQKWNDRKPSQKIICVVLGTLLISAWLLLWRLGVNSLGLPRDDASMSNIFLVPFILFGPFFAYAVWRHFSIARSYQRKAQQKANRRG